MNKEKLHELENNKKLGKSIASQQIWKNNAFIAPTILLFGGTFGIISLYNNNLFKTWYMIAPIILFLIGTIIFKGLKKSLINKKLKIDKFKIGLAIPIDKKNKRTFFLFSTGNSRYNKHYLETEKEKLLSNNILSNINDAKEALSIDETDLYLVSISSRNVSPTKHLIKENYWIGFLNKNDYRLLSNKEMTI